MAHRRAGAASRPRLVQRLLPLLAAARAAGRPATAERVDLVHENDAGGVHARAAEQVAHARGANLRGARDDVRGLGRATWRTPTMTSTNSEPAMA